MFCAIVSQSVATAAYCINPDCPQPASQPWDNKFCNSCGSLLRLKNRYIPIDRLGSGGFASIYTVWDLQTQSEKVIKVLVSPSAKALELFEQEAAVMASLHHPGVPRVETDSYFQVTVGNPRTRTLPCLVMEKINGKTLENILEENPQGCREEWVRDWLKQAVEILDELHLRQIIHRDIKPSNLMLRTPPKSPSSKGGAQVGQLVAIDFGGAKQIGRLSSSGETSSTRLISPGYSPPEQIAGAGIGPTADFYALGQTMIHLLTGQYPPDMEDPATGQLKWRDKVTVSPNLASLLDDMVQVDVQRRPATATEILERMAGASSMKTVPIAPILDLSQIVTKVARIGLKWSWVAIVGLSKAFGTSTLLLIQGITTVIKACLDTVWGMLLGAIGGLVGAGVGLWLAYLSAWGARITNLVSQLLPRIFPHIDLAVQPAFLVFMLAGFGTAIGLTEAGGFGQKRRYAVASLMGILGYGLGWFIWPGLPNGDLVDRLLAWTAIAVASLILGLGLPSHQLVHSFVVAIGTFTVFAGLVSLPVWDAERILQSIFFPTNVNIWPELLSAIAFFPVLAIAIAFWLGVSSYLIVPLLRWLGWR